MWKGGNGIPKLFYHSDSDVKIVYHSGVVQKHGYPLSLCVAYCSTDKPWTAVLTNHEQLKVTHLYLPDRMYNCKCLCDSYPGANSHNNRGFRGGGNPPWEKTVQTWSPFMVTNAFVLGFRHPGESGPQCFTTIQPDAVDAGSEICFFPPSYCLGRL